MIYHLVTHHTACTSIPLALIGNSSVYTKSITAFKTLYPTGIVKEDISSEDYNRSLKNSENDVFN